MKLSDICDVYSGYALKEFNNDSDGFPIIKIGNILTNGSLFLDDCQYSKENINEKYFSKYGDIYIALSGATTGKIGIMQSREKYIINQRVGIVRKRDNDVPESYIKYFLLHQTERILKEASGCAQPNISPKQIALYEVPNFEYEKILNIVSSLDKISNIIELRKQQHQQLDELVKARFIELFGDPITNPMGWELHRFDSLCENLDSRRKPITASERQAGIYPYYGASGIVDYVADYIFDEDILLVSEDGANLLMRSTPIAFSVSGKVWINNHAHVVRFEKMSMQKYIEVFFSLIDISDHITGSAQPKLNQAKLNAMMFPVPSDDRLEAFLQFVEQTDKSKVAVQKALDEAQTLFDSLMQEYFG